MAPVLIRLSSPAVFLAALLCITSSASAHVEENMPDGIAKIEYLMLLDINPKDIETRYKLAMVYLRLNKLEQAENELLQVLQADPSHLQGLEGMGLLKNTQKKYDEAILYFNKAIAIAPDNNHTYYYLGRTLETTGDYPGAGKAYDTAINNHRLHVSPDERLYNEDLARFEKARQDLAVKTNELKHNK